MEHCTDHYKSARGGLHKLCERFLNQPIEVMTKGGVRFCGIVLTVCFDGVEIIDKCNRVIFISLRQIDAIVQPKMTLTPFCGKSNCKCNHGDCECGREKEPECKPDKYDDYP